MRSLLFCCLATSLFLPLANAGVPDREPAKNGDWPQWRGPERNGISIETGLLKEWPKEGPKLLWDSRKVNGGSSIGTGYSSLAIAQRKIFTLGDSKQACYAFCLDAETGKEVWKTKVGPVNGDGGPRSTPTVDGDCVYTLTRQGFLACLKISDGAVLWQKDFNKDFGAPARAWGFCESPTVDGDKLLCTPGSKDAVLVALNKATGAVIWQCKLPEKMTIGSGNGYSSIVMAEVGGIKQYINLLGTGTGLIGVDATTGKLLWTYQKVANGTASIPTAIVKDDYVFASSGYNTGAALLKLVPDGKGGIDAQEQYFLKSNQLQNHHGGVVMLGDYIYGGHGHNNGLPFCLEWKTGKFAWQPQRGPGSGSAAVLYADGHLYFRYESGDMALIEAAPSGYHLKSSFRVPINGNGWPHPVIYHGRLYLRGSDQILCYDIKQ